MPDPGHVSHGAQGMLPPSRGTEYPIFSSPDLTFPKAVK
jgi:hypothetical protein